MFAANSKFLDNQFLSNEKEYLDYLVATTRKLINKGSFSKITLEKVSGIEFHKIELTLPLDEKANLHDIHYVKLFNNIFLDIKIMYNDVEKNESLFNLFESIKID
jgi:hypothetical protein